MDQNKFEKVLQLLGQVHRDTGPVSVPQPEVILRAIAAVQPEIEPIAALLRCAALSFCLSVLSLAYAWFTDLNPMADAEYAVFTAEEYLDA